MKQTIEYYYSLKIDTIFLENDTYHFVLDKKDYYFVYCNRSRKELEDLVECSKELKLLNIDCHDILLNINNEIITLVDDAQYILLRVKKKDDIFLIIEMLELSKKLKLSVNKMNLYRNNWSYLWSTKIDYIETQLTDLKHDNVVSSSIDYYIGLSENAIYYVNKINTKYNISSIDKITLSRKRIFYPNTKLNYLNPLSFIFDLEVRDIAEYVKATFFANEDAFLELQTYLKSVRLSIYSYNMLFARLLYPSYYFDEYDKIINKHLDNNSLIAIVCKTSDYQLFLKKAYQEISLYAKLENVSWLIN